MIHEIKIETFDALIDQFEALPSSGILFRGQSDATWGLQTSLERQTPAHLKPSKAEATLLYEFRRRAHVYLAPQQIPGGSEIGEWLALMQHFGAPTRLLDVTRSPYVATYFALEDARPGTDPVVWQFDRSWLLTASGAAILKDRPEARKVAEKAIAQGVVPPYVTPELIQGVESSQLLGEKWLTNTTAVVVPYVPERLSERLSIQQGEFLVPRDVDRPFMENLAALGEPGGNVTRYVISAVARGRSLERLRAMNMTRAQLFPGLDGFAQSFRQLLIEEAPEAAFERLKRRALLAALLSTSPSRRAAANRAIDDSAETVSGEPTASDDAGGEVAPDDGADLGPGDRMGES